ncbi:DUF4012 domain-containing protein [Candidatus Peribacteria bacterium]|nr:DUF4012 domain-containing protein [Candidatus Peribacteria bacterium]
MRRVMGILLVLWLGWVVWPVRWGIGLLGEEHLILLQNEAELRPCGGFTTAYATLHLLPFRLQFHNVFDLEQPLLRPLPPAMQGFTDALYFRDAGDDSDPEQCAAAHKSAYAELTGQTVDRVWMVPLSVVERIAAVVGPVRYAGQRVASKDLFALLSRSVADTDRHNLDSLADRKDHLPALGRAWLGRTLWRPWKWGQLTHAIGQMVRSGQWYIEGVSRPVVPTEQSLELLLWNLGGGKTNRYLDVTLHTDVRELQPNDWQLTTTVTLRHDGGYEEPLSQVWTGTVEMHWPVAMGGETVRWGAAIAPGGQETYSSTIRHRGPLSRWEVYVPRGLRLRGSTTVSLYPQQSLQSRTLQVREHTGLAEYEILGTAPALYTTTWQSVPDVTGPFLTYHQLLTQAPEQWDMMGNTMGVELHTNEPVVLGEGFSATIAREGVTTSATDFALSENGRTILLRFRVDGVGERRAYQLGLTGVTDVYGNPLNPTQRWTVIDKRPMP